MSIGLIGTKIGMTREFMKSGQSVPVTVIKIEKGRVIDLITNNYEVVISRLRFSHKFDSLEYNSSILWLSL